MKHEPSIRPPRWVAFFAAGIWVIGSTGPGLGANTNVAIVDFAFNPSAVTINVGEHIRWVWTGGAPHSTTSNDGLWDSGINDTGFTFTNTFNAPGNFPYHCRVHGSMRAAVTVIGGDTAPIILMQPQSRTVVAGTNVAFTVLASGIQPLTYQWQFNDAPITDATDSSLMINNVQLVNAGSYSVVVSNSLGITPSSNAVLAVTGVKGNYNGLFFDPDNVTVQNAGSFTLATAAGKFTGKVQLGKSRLSLAGQFDTGGNATNSIMRVNQTPLSVILHLGATDMDEISGTISDGTVTVPLAAHRAVFDGRQRLASQAGQYTMIVPGTSGSNLLPDGDSYGTVTVDKSGKIKLAGSLADGTKISQSVPVSKNGDGPFDVPLYGNLGLMIGWLSISNDIGGDVAWLKPNLPTAKFYPSGFSLTNGMITFNGGGLADTITNIINIDARNKVTNSSSNRLTLTFKPTNGSFSGRVTVPNTKVALPFNGVVLQGTDAGRGYFLGTGQSGEVIVTH